MALFHSSLWLSNIPLYIYHIFIYSSVDGHLGYFHALTIINSAAMNIGVHVFFPVFLFSGHMTSGDITESYGNSIVLVF